jgi:hypothetical protein
MKKRRIDRKEFGGKYVATKSYTDTKVIVSGDSLLEVYDRAIEKGIKEPVIDYIPQEGVVCIF